MNSLFVLLVVFFILILGAIAYYFWVVSKAKTRLNVLGEHSDKFAEKFIAEGLDKYYNSLETEELIKVHKCILDESNTYMDDIVKIAEMGCKEKFILDVLSARGVNTDDLVKKHLGKE